MTALRLIASVLFVTLTGCGWEQELDPRSQTDSSVDGEATSTRAEPQPVTVDRVVDGDSIELIVEGAEVELRLEGYNAPELYAEDAAGGDNQTCNGLAARAAVKELVAAADSIEVSERGTDRFGRTLGDLALDGESLVEQLIRSGHGLATGDDEDRRAHMIEAADSGLGVWGNGCGEPVVEALVIGEVQADAPGDDRNNLIDEYVQVVNRGSGGIDLDGWVLRDDTTGHHFGLPGRLDPSETLTVVTGGERADSDTAGSGTLYLEESFPVWSNDWETVILVDPNGVFADWRFLANGRMLLQ